MQFDRWTRHGRRYSHADEDKPSTYTLTTRVGEVNVDVRGDGSEFAPYVLDGTRLRHGDSECEFADDSQALKHLGQTIVSRSRLYVQRDVSGTWTDVPHGLPTRNVAHDYPREGRCTAYLDFDQIQGYAQGARLQVGIECGGGDREIFGFRFRSPVAGTFRLEWVLEVPANVDLAWITEPVDRHNPAAGTVRVGGRLGDVVIRWTRAEAETRTVTVEPDDSGGRIVRVVLGPYTVAALEWLTVYPDTIGPWATANANMCQIAIGNTYFAAPAYQGLDYFGRWSDILSYAVIRFVLPSAIPSGATIDTTNTKLTVSNNVASYSEADAPDTYWYVTDSKDAALPTLSSHFPSFESSGTIATYPSSAKGSGSPYKAWSVAETIDVLVGSLVQFLVDKSTPGMASGAGIVFWVTDHDVTGTAESSHECDTYDDPTLEITYTESGGWEPQTDAPETLILVTPAMAWR